MIEIDGSMGEGGGQILRTSLALSLLTGKAFHLRNLRAGRTKPGLQPQHLMSVRAAANIGQAQTRGADLQSKDLVFEPGPVTAGKYTFAIGTAGATSLVLHTVYLPLALAGEPSELTLTGGTHVNASPCYHFLETTWRAYMALCGIRLKLHMRRPGFYPRGGGVVEAHIQPCPGLLPMVWKEKPPVTEASIHSAVAGLPDTIAQRQARRAMTRLRDHGLKTTSREETWSGGPGTLLSITLPTLPVPTLFFGLGARGKAAERVADEAADQAIAYLDSVPHAVDSHAADQLLMPLALAPGISAFPVSEVTLHLITNAAVIRLFLEREIVCEGAQGERGTVRVGPR